MSTTTLRPAVHITGVDKAFGAGEAAVKALKQADFEARRGELVMLVGPSGCGKTTLLSIIAGTLHADAGKIEVFGNALQDMPRGDLTRFRLEHLGFVFQSFNLIPTLTVAENVAIPLLLHGVSHREAIRRAGLMLEKVGLGGREKSRPATLSGGQQQRVAIARALVHEPPLLICDEPTSALDKDTGATVMAMIRELSRAPDRCVIIVTHDHRIFKYADRIVEMEDGRITRVHEDPASIDSKYS